ncbi:hypothetical protein BDN67DRAFT_1016617 [Paxillus ammoniavirescens]|nr:hypothetical protein BDN67DRAFT_1016617 [Paxillus ammoniavirescens]
MGMLPIVFQHKLANNAPPSPPVALRHDNFDLTASSQSPSPALSVQSATSNTSSYWDLPHLPMPPPSQLTTPALTPDSSHSNSPCLFDPSPPLTPDDFHIPTYNFTSTHHGLSRETNE